MTDRHRLLPYEDVIFCEKHIQIDLNTDDEIVAHVLDIERLAASLWFVSTGGTSPVPERWLAMTREAVAEYQRRTSSALEVEA